MGGTYSYAEGSRTGRLASFSKSGYFWKTWEGEMISDGLKKKNLENGDTAAVANTWHFSIDGNSTRGENIEEISGKLQKKLESGEAVTVKYWIPFINYSHRGATCNYVYEVK